MENLALLKVVLKRDASHDSCVQHLAKEQQCMANVPPVSLPGGHWLFLSLHGDPYWWRSTELLAHLLILTCFPLDSNRQSFSHWTTHSTSWTTVALKIKILYKVHETRTASNCKLLLYFVLSDEIQISQIILKADFHPAWSRLLEPDKFKRGDLSDFTSPSFRLCKHMDDTHIYVTCAASSALDLV